MSRRRPPKSAVWLAVIGSAAAVGAAFLPWYNVPHGVTVGPRVLTGTPMGWETRYGLIALIAAGAALLFSLIAASGKARVVVGVLVIAASAVAIASGVTAYQKPKTGYIDWAAKKTATAKAPEKDIRLSLESLFQVSKLREKAGIGTYGAMGGGGLAALSGLVIMIGRRRRDSGVPSESASDPAAQSSVASVAPIESPEAATDPEPTEVASPPDAPKAEARTAKAKPRAKRTTASTKPRAKASTSRKVGAPAKSIAD